MPEPGAGPGLAPGAAMPGLRHLRRLTDDTGILEHALGIIPRRREGYSTDDQARALWACTELLELAGEQERETLLELADIYLAFLLWAQNDDGHFHNNFRFDRSKEDETPSDDCLGRCLWAAALASVRLPGEPRRTAARAIVDRALAQLGSLRFPRGWAYALSALCLLAKQEPSRQLGTEIGTLADRLAGAYDRHAGPGWKWYEPSMTYSNGLLPWGLLNAYEATGDRRLLHTGLESLDFLLSLCTNPAGQIRPVGNRGWADRHARAVWDQQPVDVLKLLLAAAKAHELTGDGTYAAAAHACRNWFHGGNDAGVPLADPAEGSCCDGLAEDGPNQNRGAESTLAYLIAEAIHLKSAADGAGGLPRAQ